MKIYGPVRIDVWRGVGKILVLFGDEHYSVDGSCFDGISVIDILNDKIKGDIKIYIENLPQEHRNKFNLHKVSNRDWLGTISNWGFEKEKVYPNKIHFIDIRYPLISDSIEVVETSLNNAEINIEKASKDGKINNLQFLQSFDTITTILINNYEYLIKKKEKPCVFSFLQNLPEKIKKTLINKETQFFRLILNNPFIPKEKLDFFIEEVYKAFSYYQDAYTLQLILENSEKLHFLCLGWGHLDTLAFFLNELGFKKIKTYEASSTMMRCIEINQT